MGRERARKHLSQIKDPMAVFDFLSPPRSARGQLARAPDAGTIYPAQLTANLGLFSHASATRWLLTTC
jgi:hypothetical protein